MPKGLQNQTQMVSKWWSGIDFSDLGETLILNDPTTFWHDYLCSGSPRITTIPQKTTHVECILKKHSPNDNLYENQWKLSSKNDSVETPFSTKFSEMTPLALKAPQIHPRLTKDIQNWEKGCPKRSLLGALVFIFRHLTCAGVRFVVVPIPRRDRHSAPVYHLCRKGNALGSRALLQRHSWQFCSSATQPPNMFSEFWLRCCSRHAGNPNGTVAECARSAFGYIFPKLRRQSR